MLTRHARLTAVPLLLALLTCCGEGAGADNGTIPSSDLADTYWSATDMPDARAVADIKASAQDGESVIVSGRVKDFVEGQAVFTLVDASLDSCREIEGDACKTPWDYCCVDPSTLAGNTVTVEVRDEDGSPLHTGIQGFHDIDHLDTVAVSGALTRDEHGNITVAMNAVHRR